MNQRLLLIEMITEQLPKKTEEQLKEIYDAVLLTNK